MKSRFSSADVQAIVHELSPKLPGLRCMNIYSYNGGKQYGIKLAAGDTKHLLVLTPGTHVHTSSYNRPQDTPPAGFAMKCRKHIRSRRLSSLRQLGSDRIIDIAFGAGEHAHHVIVELYDRGNLLLTDHNFTILALLRTRTDNEDVRFAVGERYPLELIHTRQPLSDDKLNDALSKAKQGDPLRKVLNPVLGCGPGVVEHCLRLSGFPPNAAIGKGFDQDTNRDQLVKAVRKAEGFIPDMLQQNAVKGYVFYKTQQRPQQSAKPKGKTSAKASAASAASAADEDEETSSEIKVYTDFSPFLFEQDKDKPHIEFEAFDEAVDVYVSELEAQKLEMKTIQQEQAALKKLENVRQDHQRRLEALAQRQLSSERQAELLAYNQQLVDQAITAVRALVAQSLGWDEIDDVIAEAKMRGDAVARSIADLDLASNRIKLRLNDDLDESDDDDDSDRDFSSDDDEEATQDIDNSKPKKAHKKPWIVSVDLSLSALANARQLFAEKKAAAKKEQKTIDASMEALKSAEKKTMQALKETKTNITIQKARKVYWFEKFYWFISSENYLVIGGRDRQQNELLVKRYLKKGDLYVHADLHGASSVVVKNPTGAPVPPKTLTEAGNFAVLYSNAWDAKVSTSAYWVHHDQVSKTAPSGEFLTTGSFMIRGRKNFLPPSQMVLGFGILFKLDEDSLKNHLNERTSRTAESESDQKGDDDVSEPTTPTGDSSEPSSATVGQEIKRPEQDEADGSLRADSASSAVDVETHAAANTTGSLSDNNGTDLGTDEVSDANGQTSIGAGLKKQGPARDATEKQQKEEEDEDNDEDFPDTTIELNFSGKGGVALKASRSSQADDASEDEDDQEQRPAGTKARLSAKQRRMLRKLRAEGVPEQEAMEQVMEAKASQPVFDEATRTESESSEKTSGGKAATNKPHQKQQQQQQQQSKHTNKRGKKSKLKKMKEKYAEQDEDERQMRMELLQGSGEKLTRKEKRQQRKAAGIQGSKHRVAHGAQGQEMPLKAKIIAGLVDEASVVEKEGSEPSDADAQVEEVATNSDARPRKQKDDEQGEAADNGDDDDDDDGEEDESQTESDHYLRLLTGQPRDDDELLFAIPVCAPYMALSSYKYKVKIVPGTAKKGRTIRSVMHHFATMDKTGRQAELMKAIKDPELFRSIPGKIKVMTSLNAPSKKGKK